MNIPLDNLYHYIKGLFPEPVYFYLFYPHGSKNILDIAGLESPDHKENYKLIPSVICHDQEPLQPAMYRHHSQSAIDFYLNRYSSKQFINRDIIEQSNLKLAVPTTIYDDVILLHSEKNSKDLEWYEGHGYVGVFYWSHAFIAKDWYRFAEHDKRLLAAVDIPEKDFLIYCRDCTGSREYRIKFQELLVNNNLHINSITSVKKDNFELIEFKNKMFKPNDLGFLNHLEDNTYHSSESAGYVPNDMLSTKISVVLETVYDDQKIHLTEKILRPIACGHPFMLAAGPNSLDYLRAYGFKTFSPYINEDYDKEVNSGRRLELLIDSMKQFSNQSLLAKNLAFKELKKIAEFNKQRFFSKEFAQQLIDELTVNIHQSLRLVKQTKGKIFLSIPKKFTKSNRQDRTILIRELRRLRKISHAQ